MSALISHSIAVTLKYSDNIESRILTTYPEAHLVWIDRTAPAADIRGQLESVDIILGSIDPALLKSAKNLKWIHLSSAGAESFCDPGLYARPDIVVTNSSGIFGVPIAEHLIGMMIMFARRLVLCPQMKTERKWDRASFDPISELYGATLGIIGLGDIGHELAKRARCFGMRILAVKQRSSDCPPYLDELAYGDDGLHMVLSESDHVAVCLPLTPKTRGLLSHERLSLLKPTSYLYNVGRGAVVDEQALVEMLKEGRLAGAGLDVFENEPLPADSPLWDMPNVIISPHVSGMMPHFRTRVTELFCENLERFLSGGDLRNVVRLDMGY